MHDIAPASAVDLIRSPKLPWSLRRCFRALLGIEYGSLDVALPDGRMARFSGARSGPHARLSIRSYAFVKRLGAGDVGFAEGYLAGEWECGDLVALLALLAVNRPLIDRFAANPLVRAVQMARHWRNRNSRAGSRRNIHAHYDLGNSFYSRWLDATMTYSSGLDVDLDGDLEAAQNRKYAAIAAAAEIQPHHHVLEIGCGWGGFAEYAARAIGCRVTALTISQEQYDYAKARISAAGLADRVAVRFCDYRDERAFYDRIVSIEMFEAVGEAYWRTYFETLAARLKAGGRAALQVITISEDIFPRYRNEMDFIRRFIFPGGMLPTRTHLEALAAGVGFATTSHRAFGKDYARTCQIWRDAFESGWPQIASLGFDERFRRVWRYYLAYCEAGFDAGAIDVRHITFSKPEA
ncbi:MAG: cyclopropane-fatty-acyl-phospholipid synthase family protein [Rhodoblastus sp.]